MSHVCPDCGGEFDNQHGLNRHRTAMHDPDHRNAEVLEKMYIDKEMSSKAIADDLGVGWTTIKRQLQENGIEIRSPNRAGVLGSLLEPPHFGTTVNGYEEIKTTHDGETFHVLHHRLLAVAECGFDALQGKEVHHKNGVPWDNRPDNIEIVTRKEHSHIHRIGERHPNTKLSNNDVRKIKRRLNRGEHPSEISKDFPISKSGIDGIKYGDVWNHIEI